MSTGHPLRNRKESSLDDTLAKLVYQFRANTSRCAPLNGVRKNTTRGGRVGESSAKASSSDPLRIRSIPRQQCRGTRRERDQPARQARKSLQPDEENVGFPRQLGSRAHRTWTRHGATSHCKDGTNTNATVRRRGANGDAGHHRSSVTTCAARFACGGKNRHEGDLEGEQGPGRVGQRTSSYDVRWYGPASGAKPRGTRSLRYDKNDASGNGPIEKVADRRRRKVRGGNDHGDVERLQAGGILRGVRTSMRGTASPSEQQQTPSAMTTPAGLTPPDEAAETHRTLRLAAGRNKPASPSSP